MKIEVNKNALEDLIKNEVERCINEISIRANEGFSVTELWIPYDKIHIFHNIRSKIIDTLREFDNDPIILDLGGTLSKSSMSGDRMFKIRI